MVFYLLIFLIILAFFISFFCVKKETKNEAFISFSVLKNNIIQNYKKRKIKQIYNKNKPTFQKSVKKYAKNDIKYINIKKSKNSKYFSKYKKEKKLTYVEIKNKKLFNELCLININIEKKINKNKIKYRSINNEC